MVDANDANSAAAPHSSGSLIHGMPILNLHDAQNVVFLKQSMRPGFAGIDSRRTLCEPKTIMQLGDAKESLTRLVAAVKAA